MVLAQLREIVAWIYTQKKINQIEEEEEVQNWNNFIKKVKIAYSNKSKAVDAEWKIETFKQKNKHIIDLMMEFKVLAIKTETDNMYTIFLLKKNISSNIIKIILGYLPIVVLESLKE